MMPPGIWVMQYPAKKADIYRPAWVALMENSPITVFISGAQVKRLRKVKVKARVAASSASHRLLFLDSDMGKSLLQTLGGRNC